MILLFSFLYILSGGIFLFILDHYFTSLRKDISTSLWHEFNQHRIFTTHIIMFWPYWLIILSWAGTYDRICNGRNRKSKNGK